MSLCPRCKDRQTHSYWPYCKPCYNAYMRERRSTVDRKRLNAKQNARYANDEEFRKMRSAQAKANYAYPIAQPCEIDGCQNIGERHHDDYDKPLEIRWLCRQHHMELHNG